MNRFDPSALQDQELKQFLSTHSDFDPMRFDAWAEDADDAFGRALEPAARFRLLRLQRVSRLTGDYAEAEKLIAQGYDSAHRIALDTERRFLAATSELFDSPEQAIDVYRKARSVKGLVEHLFANLHSSVASPHFAGSPISNTSKELVSAAQQIPNYWDIFGSQNFCACAHCASIFGPSAYVLDLMRIIGDYITDANDGIPSGYKLEERRPDLFTLPLTCANVNDPIKTIALNNEILTRRLAEEQPVSKGKKATGGSSSSIVLADTENTTPGFYDGMKILITAGACVNQIRTIQSYGGADFTASVTQQWDGVPDATSVYMIYQDPYLLLAAAWYPFELPYNRPLTEIRATLDALDSPLTEIYRRFARPAATGTATAGTVDSITLTGSPQITAGMIVVITEGTAEGNRRSISDYDASTQVATVSPPWSQPVDTTSRYEIYDTLSIGREQVGLSVDMMDLVTTDLNDDATAVSAQYGYASGDNLVADLAPVANFIDRTHMTRDQLVELLTQGLSAAEIAAGAAKSFFINQTDGDLAPMAIAITGSGSDAYYEIQNLTVTRLGRMSRFIRLQRALDWTARQLQDFMTSLGTPSGNGITTDIDSNLIRNLGWFGDFAQETQIAPEDALPFWSQMSTTGRGSGRFPDDMFDRTFNNPAQLHGQDPYTSEDPIPFDPARPLTWEIASYTEADAQIRSRLRAALSISDHDLTTCAGLVGYYQQQQAVPELTCDLTTLTLLYRVSKQAAVFGLSVDDFLQLQWMLYYPYAASPMAPPPGVLDANVFSCNDFSRVARLISLSRFSISQLTYILFDRIEPGFDPGYRAGDIGPMINSVATLSSGTLLDGDSFIFQNIDEADSQRIYATLESLQCVQDGVMCNNSQRFAGAAKSFPITAEDFESGQTYSAQDVMNALAQCHPPVLVDTISQDGNTTRGYLSESFTRLTDLEFLYIGDENGPNLRAKTRSTLLQTRDRIVFTLWSFLFPYRETSFVSDLISPAQSKTAFDVLGDHSVLVAFPQGATPPGANDKVLSVDYIPGTSVDYLFTSQGSGQRNPITSYDGPTRTLTCSQDWTAEPDDTSYYRIVIPTQNGTAPTLTATTVVLDDAASSQDGAYTGMWITVEIPGTSVQSAAIGAYDGTTKTATIVGSFHLPADGDPPSVSDVPYFVDEQVTDGLAQSAGPGTNTIVLAESASADSSAYTSAMTLALVPNPNADAMRRQVSSSLTDTNTDVVHVAQILDEATALQSANVVSAISDLLQSTPETVTVLLPFAGDQVNIQDLLPLFLLPKPEGQVDQQVFDLIRGLSRALQLTDTLGLDQQTIGAIVFDSQAFNIESLSRITLTDISHLSVFAQLGRTAPNTASRLVEYFMIPVGTGLNADKVATLAYIMQWPLPSLSRLIETFWPDDNDHSSDYTTLTGVLRLQRCFDTSNRTGMGIESIEGLYRLNDKGVVAAGRLDPKAWLEFEISRDAVLGALGATLASEQFDAAFDEISSSVYESDRDALAGYTLWVIAGKPASAIETIDELSQYLLIDIKMGGCDLTSPIAQASNSLQVYLQRCRSQFEPGVIDLSGIKPNWWQWIMNYRVWEANRKIFLYPENYLDPTLRQNPSPQFEKLTDDLLQMNSTDITVTDAYIKYINGVAAVANLAPVDAYYAKALDPVTNDKEDTLFFIGRSRGEPYSYQYRRHRATPYGAYWSPWKPVESRINTPLATAAFAFNRLYLFWTEIGESESSNIADNESTTVGSSTAAVKFIYQKPDASWTEPQTLVSDIALTYLENYQLESILGTLKSQGKSYTEIFNTAYSFVKKPYPLYIEAPQPPQTADDEVDEPPRSDTATLELSSVYPFSKSLFVLNGHGLPSGGAASASIDTGTSVTNDPFVLQRVVDRARSAVAATNTVTSAYRGGIMPLNLGYGVNINQNLAPTNPYISAVQLSATQVYAYQPYIDRDQNYLNINPTLSNSITTNYVSDDFPGLAKGLMLPTADQNNPFTLLDSVSGSIASIATVKNFPLNYLFDNGDQAYWFTATGNFNIFPISANLTVSADEIDKTKTLALQPLQDGPLSMSNLGFTAKRITSNGFNHYLSDLLEGGVSALLTLANQALPEPPFTALGPKQGIISSDYPVATVSFEGAFGEYMWETFFYGPTLVADILKSNNRFEEAKSWYEYLFNPTIDPSEDPSDKRYWRYLPFREMTPQTLTQMLTNPEEIWLYNNDPFNPDAIARKRISAFAKSTVTRYIDNIIAWGDNLFAIDTRESIAQATNFYLLAYELLGPRPEAVAECPSIAPKSYNDIAAEYENRTIVEGPVADGSTTTSVVLGGTPSSTPDAYTGMYLSINSATADRRVITAYNGETHTAALDLPLSSAPSTNDTYQVFVDGIPEFLIRAENSFALVGADLDAGRYTDAPYNMIDSYFCVPENPEFIAYWDTVEDRLYKIRHCLNIEGVARPLALFAPPINPADLIAAARAGLGGLGAVTGNRSVAPPLYRFSFLIEKAKSLAATVTQFGASLLATLEKKDAESLALLRSSQEKTILQLTTMVKELAVEIASDELNTLNNSLASAAYRQTHYQDLIDAGLNHNEVSNLVYQTAAAFFNTTGSLFGGLASASALIPQAGSPFAMTYGGVQLGRSLAYTSSIFKALGDLANFGASLNATMAGYVRRAGEWEFQRQLAEYETTGIADSIQAAEAKKEIAQQDLKIHKQTIKDSAEVSAFLKSKFTNEQLYKWMADKLSTLYYQAYLLSLNLALEAQRSYQYEIGVNNTYVNFNYWDSTRKGLLAGEALTLSLNQLEKAYLDGNKRPFEIEKTISLKELDPLAFIDLVKTGKCLFQFSERLFDDDYPGHYLRLIKSISVTIPAVLGPYQNFNASLTQLSNQVVLQPLPEVVDYLLGGNSDQPDDGKLRSGWMANQKIAVSTGVNDSGLFSVNFNDERYLPFEGTGAVSTWNFSLPLNTNRIDRDSISDVIFTLGYTAYDGGALFTEQVERLPGMKRYGGSEFYPMAQRFPDQWSAFLHTPPADCGSDKCQTLNFDPHPIVPPHVADGLMTGFLVQLDVAEGVRMQASATPWLTFRFRDGADGAVSFSPDDTGLFVFDFDTPVAVDSIDITCSLICNDTLAPSGLISDGAIDVAKLHNIALAILYEGDKG